MSEHWWLQGCLNSKSTPEKEGEISNAGRVLSISHTSYNYELDFQGGSCLSVTPTAAPGWIQRQRTFTPAAVGWEGFLTRALKQSSSGGCRLRKPQVVSCCPAPSTRSVRSWQKNLPLWLSQAFSIFQAGEGHPGLQPGLLSQVMELLKDSQHQPQPWEELPRRWLSLGLWGRESWSCMVPTLPRVKSAAGRTLLKSSPRETQHSIEWPQFWGLHTLTSPGKSLLRHTALQHTKVLIWDLISWETKEKTNACTHSGTAGKYEFSLAKGRKCQILSVTSHSSWSTEGLISASYSNKVARIFREFGFYNWTNMIIWMICMRDFPRHAEIVSVFSVSQ